MSHRDWERAALVAAASVLAANALGAQNGPPRRSFEGMDERPTALPDNPRPHYPLVHFLGMAGTVVVEVTIDTSGHVMPGSVAVLRSTDDDLTQPVLGVVPLLRFHPARLHGRPVALRTQLWFSYPTSSGADPGVVPDPVPRSPDPSPHPPPPWVLPRR